MSTLIAKNSTILQSNHISKLT